eukprot:920982-Amphidinium_carterae.1
MMSGGRLAAAPLSKKKAKGKSPPCSKLLAREGHQLHGRAGLGGFQIRFGECGSCSVLPEAVLSRPANSTLSLWGAHNKSSRANKGQAVIKLLI